MVWESQKHICVTDRHDMTLAVKVALNPNTTNQYNQLHERNAGYQHFSLFRQCFLRSFTKGEGLNLLDFFNYEKHHNVNAISRLFQPQ